jgi:signal transduction histidine kinase
VPDEFGLLISTINRMFARLETSFDQIREFSHSVAHELKTPLTILKGESELALRQELSQEEVQQLISTYLEETARMSRIIDDLLTLARADEGQVVVAHDSVELFPMIKELLEDVQLLGANKELLVQLVENESSAVVTGDASRLRQLFRIIVTNAVQYTDHAGSITITSVVRSGRVQISISDSGLGISPEHVERIFERFYRVDEARSRAKGGAGLGLAIAKWIVEAHHGSIRVSSLPGSGSTFTIDLPLSVTSPLHPV